MELYIQLTCNADVRSLYEARAAEYNAQDLVTRDAGFDLFFAEQQEFTQETKLVGLGCKAAVFRDGKPHAFWLVPRSSIYKTSLRQANSLGIIDAGYRGPLMAACDYRPNGTTGSYPAGTRLFQVVSGDMSPWIHVHITDELPTRVTNRGEGGFGSTN